ncbi:retrovirus-related pol polyprotein from transposon TNT 1-94 [Tanacetum coccineum]
MIGCKVMRTLVNVEIEIMLILGFPCYLSSSSSVRYLESYSACCLENFVDSRRMSTLVFLDPEISTQADGAQSSRVPVVSNSDDIQAAGSDTRPPMLDRTDYDSWSQRIRLYCRGKENGIYILQSIDHGPFKLGTTRDTLGTTPEGGVLLGPKRPRTYVDLNDNDKKRFDVDVRATNIMLPRENINEYYVRFHKLVNDMRNIRMTMPNIQLNSKFVNNMSPEWDRYTQTDEILDTLTKQVALLAQQTTNSKPLLTPTIKQQFRMNKAGKANAGQGKPIKCYNCNGLGHIARNCTQPKLLDEEELLFLAGEQTNTFNADVDDQPVRDLTQNDDNNFQADECDAFDSDDKHETHNEVQQKHVIDSNGADMGKSNVILYEQYLTINEVFVEPSCASSVPNDAYVLHDNNAYIPYDPLVTELNIYKQQVAMYEQHAKFDLKLREQKMDEQMSILIQDRNKKEENLKKELDSVKLQLNSTIKSNKIIEETVTALKHEFKQKETKFLIDFSNLKKLNDKLENKLYLQDHSIQTVHMMLKPKKLYDQDAVTAIGAQKPFYLRKAKMVQPAHYDGDEIFKTHHVPVSVTSSEKDLEIVKITRQKINEKMNDPMCGKEN